MRRSPRRPLILKKRRLHFLQSDRALRPHDGPASGQRSPDPAARPPCFPDGLRIMDHPTMRDTQVVVRPTASNLQSVIGALTAKGKECGPNGPNKFIILSGSAGPEGGPHGQSESGEETPAKLKTNNSQLDTKSLSGKKPGSRGRGCSPLDESLTNMQWLGRMTEDVLEPDPAKAGTNAENCPNTLNTVKTDGPETDADPSAQKHSASERPPFSYMTMIQFAINSTSYRRMTLKEIYTWIEDHFPFFREQAKPGWKNSIRHNLSLHDMFVRQASPDGKIAFWTIRPEANRCLTLDQVHKPGWDTTSSPLPLPMRLFPDQQPKKMIPDSNRKTTSCFERKMKPLLPRTDSYFVPIQIPATSSSIYLPSSTSLTQLHPPRPQPRQSTPRGAKRVRIAPKAAYADMPSRAEVKEESVSCEIPCCPQRREAGSSRRKQRLVLSAREEPILFLPDSTFFDSGVASDTSIVQDTVNSQLEPRDSPSPCRGFSLKTPVKGGEGAGAGPASSTPSHPLRGAPPPLPSSEPWRGTPLRLHSSPAALDFSPIRTPSGPEHTPQHQNYTPFSFSSTPFKELPLFGSPSELLASPQDSPQPSAPQANRSLTEGLVLDTMNDSLRKVLVDISFPGLEDDDLGLANISWSDIF